MRAITFSGRWRRRGNVPMSIPYPSRGDVLMSVNDQRLVALFAVALLLFNQPLLDLVSQPWRIGPFPLLYLYIQLAWLAVILALAWLLRRAR